MKATGWKQIGDPEWDTKRMGTCECGGRIMKIIEARFLAHQFDELPLVEIRSHQRCEQCGSHEYTYAPRRCDPAALAIRLRREDFPEVTA